MFGHNKEGQTGEELYYLSSCATNKEPIDVSYAVGSETERADEIPNCVCGVLRVGEVNGEGHCLETDVVIVDVNGNELHGIWMFVCIPIGGRLDVV